MQENHSTTLEVIQCVCLQAFAGLAVYTASKFFVEALTQSLRLEIVGSGVKVTSIQPGMTVSEIIWC